MERERKREREGRETKYLNDTRVCVCTCALTVYTRDILHLYIRYIRCASDE